MQFNKNYWMQVAIDVAKKSVGVDLVPAHDKEIPVCALIVRGDNLISIATNKIESNQDATAHAEIIAIREASKVLGNWRLDSCTLYVTLEPCSMCAGAIINSRISKLVFGAYDPLCGACGSVINLFKEMNKLNQIEVIGGILELEASEIIKKFFLKVRHA